MDDGRLLWERAHPSSTLEHQAAYFKIAFAQIREALEKHKIQDLIVSIERTGNYQLIPKRALPRPLRNSILALRIRSLQSNFGCRQSWQQNG